MVCLHYLSFPSVWGREEVSRGLNPSTLCKSLASESCIPSWGTIPLRLDLSAFFPSLGRKAACKPCLPCDDIHGCSEG